MDKNVQPIFKISMLVLLVVAFGTMLKIQVQIAGLQRQQKVLFEELGDFRNVDVNKVCVLRMETDDPFRFKWRFILPYNKDFKDHFEFETGKSVTHDFRSYKEWGLKADRSTAIFFEFDDGRLAIHQTGSNDAKHSFPKGNKLAGFLREHWQALQIEVADSGRMVEFSAEDSVELFALRIPKELIEQFEKEFSGPIVDQVKSGPLFRYTIGLQ